MPCASSGTGPWPRSWWRRPLCGCSSSGTGLAKYHREVPLEDANTWAAQEEERSELAEALPDGLSKSEREVLLLFYEEECSHQEIARRLGISEMNSRTRLFRAKNHCKKLLEKISRECHNSRC